jgi:hypothetical protein
VKEIKLTLSELELLTGFSLLTLKKKLESVDPQTGPNSAQLYPLKESVQALYCQGEDSLAGIKLKRELEETRLATARARKLELENAEKEKRIIPIDEAEAMYAELIGNFKNRILAIPSKSAFILANTNDPAEAEAHLTEVIAEAFDELTRKPAESCEAST